MKRLGFYTGTLYNDSTNLGSIKECYMALNQEDPILKEEKLLLETKNKLKERCIGCFGCEESRKII